MAQNSFACLDVGSSRVRAVVLEYNASQRLSVLGFFETPSLGLRRGRVVDFNDLVQVMGNILSQIRNVSKPALKNIFLSLPSVDFKMHRSRGSVAVSRADLEISEGDVSRAMDAARAIHVPHNRMLVHTITREFMVDGVSDITDPLGMMGGKLEVDSLIVDLFAPSVKSLSKSVEMGGGQVETMIFEPLSVSRAVLSKNQKDLGVMSLDIGHSITSLSVFEEGKLMHLASFPLGAGNITNDLAIGLKSSIEIAEKAKLAYGHAISREIPQRSFIELQKLDSLSRGQVSRKFVAEIIEARLAEILEFVNNELKSIGRYARLPAGVILSGGGSKCPGLLDLVRRDLKLPSSIAMPDTNIFDIDEPSLYDKLTDVESSTLVGLVLWRQDIHEGIAKKGFYGQNRWWRRALKLFIP